nr:transglycosylase SLT domain-containing protein [Roseovarius spongiae]
MIISAPTGAFPDDAEVRPVARAPAPPPMRWAHRPESAQWTRSALEALRTHGAPLAASVPRDIAQWCPGYETAAPPQRRAFWVGFLSALAKYESTWRPNAVGGGGRWFGLLQIQPSTARGYGCRARSGQALKNGNANLSCAIRILARTVPRDRAIALRDGRWRGVAADWGPMRSKRKRAEMAAWLRGQSYCAITRSPRPKARPAAPPMRRADR